jgi:limonene-1,2-epoxide hydrolase
LRKAIRRIHGDSGAQRLRLKNNITIASLSRLAFPFEEGRRNMISQAFENATVDNNPILPAITALLRLDEVSAILRRSMCALRNDIKTGRINHVRIGGRILIEETECRRIIEEGRPR